MEGIPEAENETTLIDGLAGKSHPGCAANGVQDRCHLILNCVVGVVTHNLAPLDPVHKVRLDLATAAVPQDTWQQEGGETAATLSLT